MESIKLKMHEILTELNKLNGENGMMLLGECAEFDLNYKAIGGDGDETAVRFELSVPTGPTLVILAKGVNIIRDIQIAESITFDIPRYLGIRELVYLDVLKDTNLTALTVEFIKLLASNDEFQLWWESIKGDDTSGILEARERSLKKLSDARIAITQALHGHSDDTKFVDVNTAYDNILARAKMLSDMDNKLVFKSDANNAIDFDVGAFSVSILRLGNALVVHIGADSDFGLTKIAVHNLLNMDRESTRDMLMHSLNDAVSEYFDNTDYVAVHPDRLDVDVALELIMQVIYGEVK